MALENSGESVALSTMLSFTDILPMRPILFRSSGMWETFSRMKPLGVNWATLEPFMSTSPPSGVSTPVTTWASWLWPLPSTPAMPTISPRPTVRETPLSPACLEALW